MAVGMVFVDYDEVLNTRASHRAAQKEHLCRKDRDVSSDFY